MKIFQLSRRQVIPISLQDSWDFFQSPNNLAEITPKELALRIKVKVNQPIYNGMIIEYDVKPLLNIPLLWLTEIKHVNAPYFFVDEQRFGPYKFWYHQHFFKEVPGGTEVVDEVYYGLPYGCLSGLIDRMYVRRQLDHIFDYRFKTLEKKFGRMTADKS